MRWAPTLLAALLLLGGAGASAIAGDGNDFDGYAELVRRVVKEDGVDYGRLRSEDTQGVFALLEEARLIDAHVRKMGHFNGRTQLWSQAEWINYHNAMVLKGIADGKSPKEACKVLDEFKFSDPRIHFALHRAARSSPKLRYYRQSTLDDDLTQAVRVFLNDKRHNSFRAASLEAELSELFYWHMDECVATVKEPSGAPFQIFLAKHAPRASLGRRLTASRWTIKFRKFDWRLNESGVAADSEERGGSPMLWVYLVAAGTLLLYGLHSFRALLRRRRETEDLD